MSECLHLELVNWWGHYLYCSICRRWLKQADGVLYELTDSPFSYQSAPQREDFARFVSQWSALNSRTIDTGHG